MTQSKNDIKSPGRFRTEVSYNFFFEYQTSKFLLKCFYYLPRVITFIEPYYKIF